MSRAVRIAMLDSGVSPQHPHIRRALHGGVTITPAGDEQPDFVDRLGHGTAVCAVIQEMAPLAELYAVRIFDQQLATSISVVLHAMDWCVRNGIDIINLSLGTTNQDHAPGFRAVIDQAHAAGAVVVSAFENSGAVMLPGAMSGVIGVVEAPACPRDELRLISEPHTCFGACPYPLDIPGVPRERNLHGVSFSIAHASAVLARIWPWQPDALWPERLAATLR